MKTVAPMPAAARAAAGVDRRVTRHRTVEGPPELHRAEARGLRGRGPLQQRQLGEQHGAVGQVPQRVAHDPLQLSTYGNVLSLYEQTLGGWPDRRQPRPAVRSGHAAEVVTVEICAGQA